MADIGEITVRINGDASGLIAAISSAQGSLAGLSGAAGSSASSGLANGASAALSGFDGVVAKGRAGLEAYKKQMDTTYATLSAGRRAFRDAKTDYEQQKSVIDASRGTLIQHKAELDKMIAARTAERNLLLEANRTLDKNSEAYVNNANAIQWIGGEIDAYKAKSEGIANVIKGQDAALEKSKNSYEQAGKAVSEASASYEKLEKGLSGIERASRAQEQVNRGKGLQDLGKGIDDIAKPIYAMGVASAAGLGLAAKAAIDFEDSFASVKKTVDGTPEQLNAIKQGIIDMTTVGVNGHSAIPMTTAQLNELAAAGGQLGIKTENIVDFTETMAELGTATNLTGELGAKTIARFMNVANVSQDQVKNLGSAIVDLGNHYATTEAEIADMALSMGATGTTVGMSAQEILGYSTALSSMGIEAQAGGSSLQRIWMDMQNAVSTGGEDLENFAKISGKSSKEFADQWKSDASGAFQSFLKGLNASKDQVGVLAELGFKNVRDQRALLALAGEKGFELLTDAINRSNKAWSDNTALQKEFDAKADTTASKMAVMKNNAVEAARSFGEVMLPSLVDVTGGLKNTFAGLAKMDDGAKKALINTGAVIVGLGVATKVTAGALQGFGRTVAAVGKIKGLFSAGGALAGAAPALSSIASAAGPAAIGIAGVAAAALIGKAAYDHWYNSTYKFADGLKEEAEQVNSSYNNWKRLNDLRFEYNDLTYRKNQGEFEGEELEAVEQRLGEIKQALAEEFKINVDSGDLDAALEKAEKLNEFDYLEKKSDYRSKVNNNRDKYEAAVNRLPQEKQAYEEAAEAQGRYAEARLKVAKAREKYNSSQKEQKDLQEYVSNVRKAMSELGMTQEDINAVLSKSTDATRAAETALAYFDEKEKALNLDEKKQYYEDSKKAIEDYKQACEGLAKLDLKDYQDALKSGADGTQYLNEIAQFAKDGLIDGEQFARQAALIQSGKEKIDDVFAAGGETLDNFVNNYISNMQRFGATADQTSQGAALLKEGFTDMSQAFGAGDAALSKVVQNYAANMTKLGASSEQVQAGLQNLSGQYTDFLHTTEQLPTNQVVRITAEGDIEKIQVADEKLNDLSAKGEVKVKFNVDSGEHDIFDLDGNKLGTITVDGEVKWNDTPPPQEGETVEAEGEVNWENNPPPEGETVEAEGQVNWDETDPPAEGETVEAEGQVNWDGAEPPVIAPVQADGSISWEGIEPPTPAPVQTTGTVDWQVSEPPALEGLTAEGSVNMDLGESPSSVPDASGVANYTLGSYPTSVPAVTGVVNYVLGSVAKPNAKGTSNFSGGLAMVNDQKNVRDPRELIIDRGRAFIPEGRDVVLPLHRGAKVYTAAQTKAIMAGWGIPHFAKGYNVDDEDLERQFQHMEKLAEAKFRAMGYTAENAKKTAQAQWDSVRKDAFDSDSDYKVTDEKNSDEFKRAKDKWTHYTKTHAVTTTEELEKWVELSEKYKDNEKDVADIEEEIFSLTQKQTKELNKKSKKWLEERSALNDWMAIDDTPIDAWGRIWDRNMIEVNEARMTWDEFTEEMSDIGSEMYKDRVDQSYNWLEHEKKYNHMSAEDYIAGLERMKAYTEEYYAWGIISAKEHCEGLIEYNEKIADAIEEEHDRIYSAWEHDADAWHEMRSTYHDWEEAGDSEDAFWQRRIDKVKEMHEKGIIDHAKFIDDTNKYSMEQYKFQESQVDKLLQKQSDYITSVREKFQEEEQALRDSWAVEDRKADMAEVQEQLDIYKGAVTDRGQQKYKELQDQLKQLQRDEQMYQLEQSNNATLKSLEDEYKKMEEGKKNVLKGLQLSEVDIEKYVNTISNNISGTNNSVVGLLAQMLTALQNQKRVTINNNDIKTDNRKITQSFTQMSREQIQEHLNHLVGR